MGEREVVCCLRRDNDLCCVGWIECGVYRKNGGVRREGYKIGVYGDERKGRGEEG